MLEDLPGRSPRPDDVMASKWYNALSTEDKEGVRDAVRRGAIAALYGVLLILDRLKPFKTHGHSVDLELTAAIDGEKAVLNDQDDELLTTIFKDVTGINE